MQKASRFLCFSHSPPAKRLKDRKGRTLSAEEIAHYQRMVVALHETIRLMGEIDALIEEYGGWPGAFQELRR